jgi:hypothetical protein
MRNKQNGVSLGGLLVVLFVVVIVAIFGLKLAPSYMEYFRAKAAVEAIGRDRQSASVAEIRKAFDARATIDDISTIKGSDLDVTKEGAEVVVSFGYRKEVPMFSNVGLYIDFAASSKGQ